MCMLCVVQKWSRRVIRVLPWLVIPLVGLWALSQLLAPGLQFEITSPRVACVIVLLVTVFWYEVLQPQFTAYWAWRSARIREQQRMQALELQKLRKVATRRCRNCQTTYREQNPAGGKFMCSYCGHVSRRPVLDLPGPQGRSGFISNLFGNNSWFCGHDYSVEGSENYVGRRPPPYWGMSSEEHLLAGKSYSRAIAFTWKLLLSFFSYVKWIYQRVLRLSSYLEDGFSDTERKGLSRKDESGVHGCQEDKGEKARRKAEEKRQARLEKEMLEEEERKQREEVARLIEERRKSRDENLETEKGRLKDRASDGERDNRKESESEKRRHGKRKEKDKSSRRSNSDGEGPEKRETGVTEKKHEYERKGEAKKGNGSNPRNENQKTNVKVVNSVKDMANKSKCFDRMEGALLCSSGSLNWTTSLRKGSHTSTASVTNSGTPIGSLVDRMQRRECHAVEHHVNGRSLSNGDTKTTGAIHPWHTQTGTLTRPWHQLFTCPSAGLPCPDANAMETVNHIGQPEIHLLDQKVPSHPLHKQMQFGQSSATTAYPLMSGSSTGNSASLVPESTLSLAGEPGHNFTREGIETFEGPYYEPDLISLIGPVSESLDNFFVDAGSGFTADFRLDHVHNFKHVCDSADANRPSPIESPMSKLWLFEERHTVSGPGIQKSEDHGDSPDGEPNDINQGTWQMWSSPLCQDLLGLVAEPAIGLLAAKPNRSTHDEVIHPPAHIPMASCAVEEINIHQSAFNLSHSVRVGNSQNDGMMSSVTPMLAENDPWLQGSVLHPFPGDVGSHFAPFDFNATASQHEVVCRSPKRSSGSQTLDQLPAHFWCKDWAAHGGADVGVSNSGAQHIGGFLPSDADALTVWPLKHL